MKKIIFFCFLIICLAVFFSGCNFFNGSQDAKHWPTTNGRVVLSTIQTTKALHEGWYIQIDNRRISQKIYEAKVYYEYSVGGKKYLSSIISFSYRGSHSQSEAQKIIAKYPKNKEVIVYYEPQNPANAVLESDRNCSATR